jgi:uncharacterized protein with PQ loop repeat
LFAGCGFPQAFYSWKQGHSRGISSLMLWMWFFGEVLAIIYVLGKIGIDKPLLFNYTLNLVFISIILKYKYLERK